MAGKHKEVKTRGGVDRSKWATAGELADRTLLLATRSGRLDRLDMALTWGANPDRLDDKNRTALERAVYYNHPEVCQRLIDRGCSITSRDEYGGTVLMKAAAWGKVDTIKVLLKNGADLRDRDLFGMTTFLRAVYAGQLDMVEFLLTQGVNVLDTDHQGRNAIQLAEYWRSREKIEAIAHAPKIVDLLIEEIAKVTATEDEIRDKLAAETDGWSDEEVTDSARERRKLDMRSRLLAATGSSIVSTRPGSRSPGGKFKDTTRSTTMPKTLTSGGVRSPLATTLATK